MEKYEYNIAMGPGLNVDFLNRLGLEGWILATTQIIDAPVTMDMRTKIPGIPPDAETIPMTVYVLLRKKSSLVLP